LSFYTGEGSGADGKLELLGIVAFAVVAAADVSSASVALTISKASTGADGFSTSVSTIPPLPNNLNKDSRPTNTINAATCALAHGCVVRAFLQLTR